MAKPTTTQKDAMERLRGNPQPGKSLQLADAEWKRLMKAVADALQWPNATVAASIADLQAIFNRQQPGQNCNGWTNPYPKDDPRSLMKQYQFVSFHDTHQFIMDIWSRQTGKDFTVALRAATDAFTEPNSQWVIAAPSERQSLETLEKCKTMVEAFGDVIHDFSEEREGSSEALLKSASIILKNGAKIRAVPGMPHTVRGLTGKVAITEADFLEKPKETMRALLGSIANEEAGRKDIRLITTPNGKQGYTYGIWNDAESIYHKRLVTIWHAVCLGIKQKPAVLEKALNDPEGWAQEFLCEWLDGSSVLLSYEQIQSCESVEASEHDTPEMLAASPLAKVGGIDFGRISAPTVMTTALHGLDMAIVRSMVVLRGMSTPDQLEVLGPYIALCDLVAVDYTGPGVGFGDLAVKEFGEWSPEGHSFGKIMLCNFSLPFKREIFPRLRTTFEKRNIRIPHSIDLREDLHAMQMVIRNAQYNYKAPRTDEGHSDRCTSMALMEHARAQQVAGCMAPHRFSQPGQSDLSAGGWGEMGRRAMRRIRGLVG